MTRYTPSRNYLTAGAVALALAVLSAWVALRWPPTIVPAILFAASGALLLFLALRPEVEIHPHHLRVGKRTISWPEVLRVDRTGWISPLILHLSLTNGRRLLLVYPGDYESSNMLLKQIRRSAFNALIDGAPHQQFWAEPGAVAGEGPVEAPKPPAAKRYPLLRAEDEADIERMFQRLKAVGRLDPKDEG